MIWKNDLSLYFKKIATNIKIWRKYMKIYFSCFTSFTRDDLKGTRPKWDSRFLVRKEEDFGEEERGGTESGDNVRPSGNPSLVSVLFIFNRFSIDVFFSFNIFFSISFTVLLKIKIVFSSSFLRSSWKIKIINKLVKLWEYQLLFSYIKIRVINIQTLTNTFRLYFMIQLRQTVWNKIKSKQIN